MSDSMCTPSINIAPYMFVRSLHDEEDRNLEMPFQYTQFGAVLMVDIVGFSQMTSIASSKGDVGAEMLSSQIGAYFDIAIRIIEYHGGDVVKFLGDALLVVFQADPVIDSDSNTPSSDMTGEDDGTNLTRRNRVIVRKAMECGRELLARLSNYRIYLSEREFSRKLSGSSINESTLSSTTPGIGTGPNDDGYFSASNASQGGNGNNQWNNFSAGTMSSGTGSIAYSYLSVPASRSNTSISMTSSHQSSGASSSGPRRSSVPNNSGSPLSSKFPSGNNLDIAGGNRGRDESFPSYSRPGSTTSKKSRAGAFLASAKNFFTNSNFSDRQGVLTDDMTENSHELQLHLAMSAGPICDMGHDNGLNNLLLRTTGRLEYAICGEQMATIDDALNMARAGELILTDAAWNYIVDPSKDNKDNKEIKLLGAERRRHCWILKNNQNTNEDPLLRRIRNDKLLNTSVESNPHYYKYINKSAIHRLILYPDNTFPAQFRTVTILFVSLGDVKPWTREGLATCQKAIYQVHKVTSEYEGFIQQFAVDDKGATILCAFGLPYPRSHEREAVFAAKSAWVIRHRLLDEGISGFKISLATGVIFTSMIGNEFRRDPAIVGDTIVIAVRILKFDYATESVVCDDATKEACTSDRDGLCEFEDMGEEFVKGKIHPIKVWRLVHFGAKTQVRRPDDTMVDETIGYDPEREKVAQFIKSWGKQPDKNTIMVSGPRGSGKSMFYQQICHIADKDGYSICSAASAEVEKSTEYYLCRFLLIGLLDIMKKKDIPYRNPADQLEDLGITIGELDLQQCSLPLQRLQLQQLSKSNSMASPITVSTITTAITMSSTASIQSDNTINKDSFPTGYPYSPITPKFGPSVRSSINTKSPRETTAYSPTISQFGGCSRRSSTCLTRMQALINLALQKMGESNDAMHDLYGIVDALSSDDYAPVMDDRDDQILSDFIVRILNYASAYVKIIVMFEDVQWSDNKSLHIIQVIHECCPNVLVVIFSRPQRDYGGNVLRSITGHSKHLEISLEGLKRREIEFALLKAFEDNGVTKISPEVIELVQEKTKGNPKFVKSMANMLKDFCYVNIVDGELLTTGQEATQSPSHKNMEEMLVKQDRKKMVLMQYDRMKPKFQDLLKIASCLGEEFSLAEVAAIRPLESMLGTPGPRRSFPIMLCDLDSYRFLSLVTEPLSNMQFSENISMNTLYKFTSESTAKYIYESIPYEERVAYHMKMGQFYESFLNPAQFSDLLPQITRHYLKTDQTEKKIKYLKALSAFDLKSNTLTDATQSLTELIRILDTERGAASMVSQEDLAEIYGMKGESLSKRMRIEEAEPALLDSLARYGVQWPKSSQQWRVTLFMEKTKFSLQNGSSTPGKTPKAKVDAKTQVNIQRIIRVLGCLQNVYFWKTHPNAAMLTTLYALNLSRKLGLPSSEYAVSLARYGILCYIKGNKQGCFEYMEKAWTANDLSEGTEGMLPSIQAYVEYCEGRREKAHQLLRDSINESKSFGVVSNLAAFYRSVTLKCACRMWEGSLNVYREDSALLRAMSAVAIQNGDAEGETLFAVPTLANLLLQDRLRDAESWVLLIEQFIRPRARLMNLLVIHGMLSFYYAKMGAFSKAKIYAELLAEGIPEQGPAAHPFPLMSCVFTVMALYEMLESAGPNMTNTPLESPYISKTEYILRPVIQSLTDDPFHAVSQSFVILAEALRCFIQQGNNREGYQKLCRGWERMKDKLEGLQFVQAYYLTMLGRHSEHPEEKDEYYNQAYVLFCKMAMDTSGWLTDPSPGWRHPQFKEVDTNYTFEAIPTTR
ncbi:hypothetical protein BGX26_002527 [Mortierella sp. AD094]|nr:hypothetical protein BGX26_002527 [Mortierella sp. AD094]